MANYDHVDLVIGGPGRPQENMIFRFSKIHIKNCVSSRSKNYFAEAIAQNIGSDGKLKFMTLWALQSAAIFGQPHE